MDNNLDHLRNELDKDIENDLISMYDLKRTESSINNSVPERKEEKGSLVVITQDRLELFEKIRKTWSNSHRRIKEFNQKKIQKYQQLFKLKYMYIIDSSDATYHKRINAISKYTVSK
jgi:hypothetical protein